MDVWQKTQRAQILLAEKKSAGRPVSGQDLDLLIPEN
jgi:hypothetical protein